MERAKRSLLFWMLLLISIALPATAQTPVKKILFQAKIKALDANTGNYVGKGVGQITAVPTGLQYYVFTHDTATQVQKVSLRPSDNSWEIVICETGSLVGNCKYDIDGNVDMEGPISDTMMILSGVSGKTLHDTLKAGDLWIHLDNGVLGSGNFQRLF